MAWILFGITFISSLTPQTDGVSHVAHLGGMLVGWLYLNRAWRVTELWREIVWRIRRRDMRDAERCGGLGDERLIASHGQA